MESEPNILPIMLLGRDAVLRERAKEVEQGTDLKTLAEEMRKSMSVSDGVGIAAPQVGESIRMFVLARDLFPRDVQGALPTDTFINPTLSKRGFKRIDFQEGCLSIPRVFGDVSRHVRVSLDAYDLDWNKVHVSAEDLLAYVFQHEVEHLDGTLFVDKAKSETLHKIELDDTARPWSSSELSE